MRYQFHGRLLGKSGEGVFILYSLLKKTFIIVIVVYLF